MIDPKLTRIFADDPQALQLLETREMTSALKEILGGKTAEQLKTLESRVALLEAKDGLDFKALTQLLKDAKGEKGDDGEDYVLTEADKAEIASKIEVPVVEKTIVEKTEVIHEQPIVNNIIKEKAVADEPKILAEKINTLTGVIELKVLKDLEVPSVKDIIEALKTPDFQLETKHIKGLPINMNDMRWHGSGVPKLAAGTNITLTPLSGGGYTISATGGGGGTPALPLNSVQYNNATAFGGFGYSDGTNLLLGSLGSETIVNGNFATNTTWSYTGGWTYDSTNKAAKFTSVGNPSNVAQTFGSLQAAGVYRYSITVSNRVGSGTANHFINLFNNSGGSIVTKNIGITNGTYTGFIYSSQAIRNFFVTAQTLTGTVTFNDDDVSFIPVTLVGDVSASGFYGNLLAVSGDVSGATGTFSGAISGASGSFTGNVSALSFTQNGNTVIDSSTIGAQSVAHATTSDLASAGVDPFVIGDGTGIAQIQSNASVGAYNIQVDTSGTNIGGYGGMSISVYALGAATGTFPTFGFRADYTPTSGPLVATFVLGDIDGGWNTTPSQVGAMSYTTDTRQIKFGEMTIGGYTPNAVIIDNVYNTIMLPSAPTSPSGAGNNPMFITDAATAVTNNYNVVCIG